MERGGLLFSSVASQFFEIHGARLSMNLLSLQTHPKSVVEHVVAPMEVNAHVVCCQLLVTRD